MDLALGDLEVEAVKGVDAAVVLVELDSLDDGVHGWDGTRPSPFSEDSEASGIRKETGVPLCGGGRVGWRTSDV
ncbi:hypothetical protein GCM10009849_17780 [Sinomonas flava]|uniref:Uncharacterized protein n=1 Tax=Sinomonas flava TaxID=496857 RepID=A0ABN3BSS1_9MICC